MAGTTTETKSTKTPPAGEERRTGKLFERDAGADLSDTPLSRLDRDEMRAALASGSKLLDARVGETTAVKIAGVDTAKVRLEKEEMGGNFTGSEFSNVIAKQCNLRGGVYYGATFNKVDFGADCSGDGAAFVRAKIVASDLSGLGRIGSLRDSEISIDSSLRDLDLRKTNLKGLRFTGYGSEALTAMELYERVKATDGEKAAKNLFKSIFGGCNFNDRTEMDPELRRVLSYISKPTMLHPYHQGEIKGKDALFQELDKNPHFATSLTDLQTAGVNSKGDVYKIALGSGPDGGPSGQITVTAVPDIRGKGDRFTISYKLDGLDDQYLVKRGLTPEGLDAEGRPVTYTAQEALMKTLAAVREMERQLIKKPLESADVVEEPEEEVEPGYKVDRLEAEAEAKAEETKTETPEAEAKPLETAAEEKTETATEPATTLAEGDVVPATAETVFANRGYGFALCEGAEVFFHAHRSAAPQFDAEGNLTGWSKVAPDSGRIEMPDEKSNLVIHVQKQPDSSKRAGYVAAAWCTREQYDAARDEAMSAAAA